MQKFGSRDFWKIFNSVINKGWSSILSLIHGPDLIPSPKDKAKLFAKNFFSSSTLESYCHSLPSIPIKQVNPLIDIQITPVSVAKVIPQLNSSTACDPDNIPVIVLQNCFPELALILSKIFNDYLTESCFPVCWKMTSAVPIFKNSGETSQLLLKITKKFRDNYYKKTNIHNYLNYKSHHPFHIKKNIPYNLAKRIIVFTSNYEIEKIRLAELKSWLKDCEYPDVIINNAFHNAKLQGPAPQKKSKETFPLIITFYSNLNCQPLISEANLLLKVSHNERVKNVFSNIYAVLAFKQPPNLLRRLTSYEHTIIQLTRGISDLIKNSQFTLGIFMDLAKAFGTINHKILAKRSKYYGIIGNVLKWLKSYLTNCKQFIYADETFSLNLLNVICGVLQGSILVPLSSLIYINDLKYL
ncbi:uncharacterized protein LOC136088018 [Hydra vulgaris]|uniref:Uncharacterized protein LOC136088018 n=1 Tax=Hydra vulgaris TaxID=6087 RepID=A0ABM4D0H0_HYDVU